VSDTVKLNFKSSPDANFNMNNVCAKQLTAFNDLSTTTSGSITGLYWDFGDSGTSNANTGTHSYVNPGTYTVSHVVYGSNGCNDTIKKPVEIYFLPQAYFITTSCVGNTTQFVDSSKTLSGGIVSWQWNFGDSQSSTIQNPQHSYSSANNYTVSLIATSSFGCKDTIYKSCNCNLRT
jgi:PKD repeat protein